MHRLIQPDDQVSNHNSVSDEALLIEV